MIIDPVERVERVIPVEPVARVITVAQGARNDRKLQFLKYTAVAIFF